MMMRMRLFDLLSVCGIESVTWSQSADHTVTVSTGIVISVNFLLSRLLVVTNVIDGVGSHRAVAAILMNGCEKKNADNA